jgi:hypothetical protein
MLNRKVQMLKYQDKFFIIEPNERFTKRLYNDIGMHKTSVYPFKIIDYFLGSELSQE